MTPHGTVAYRMKPMSDSPDLLDFAGAAARLGVPVRWMRRAVAERRLPFVKVGRYVRFRPEDLDGYVEQNVVTSRPAESAT